MVILIAKPNKVGNSLMAVIAQYPHNSVQKTVIPEKIRPFLVLCFHVVCITHEYCQTNAEIWFITQ